MITEYMKEFIDANKKHKVVYGALLEPSGIKYKLDNGQWFVLSPGDTKSAPDFTPDWGFDK